MSSQRLLEVAAEHFSHCGYDGTSLANIAADVGIKKPSIYAHFNSKKDLFSNVFDKAAEKEFTFWTTYFQTSMDMPLKERLYGLLSAFLHRYDNDMEARFWLRTSFFPPTKLYDFVLEKFYNYLDQCEETLTEVFETAIIDGEIANIGAQKGCIAFMSLLDGMFVEMLYGGRERTERRIHASWELYWRGLST